MKAWKRLDDTTVQTVGFRTVVRKWFEMNSGKIFPADIDGEENNKVVEVIALTPENKVIIARQFRCGPEKIMEEMPGGNVDVGEKPEDAAMRELHEEVGYSTDNLEHIGNAYADAWNNTLHYFYIATNCYKVDSNNPDEFEEIEIDTISIDQFIYNALNARMTDVQGVLLAYDRLRELSKG